MTTKQEIMAQFKLGTAFEFLCSFKDSTGIHKATIIGETFEQARQIWAPNDEIVTYTQDKNKLAIFHANANNFFNSEN